MLSTAKYLGSKIDARVLKLSGEFFNLSQEQNNALIRIFFNWCVDLLSNSFLMEWAYNEKTVSVKRIKELLSDCSTEHMRSLFLQGMVKCDEIHTSRQMKDHFRKLNYFVFPYDQRALPSPWTHLPTDYRALFEELILNNYNDIDKICSGFRTIAEMEHKHAEWYHVAPDCIGSFFCNGENNTFSGDFCLSISIVALDDAFSDYVAEFQRFTQKLADSFSTMNLCLGLSAYITGWADYRTVFNHCYPKKNLPGHKIECKNRLTLDNNLTDYHFCSGLSWLNILSHDTVNHLGTQLPKSTNDITVKTTCNKGLEIYANCDIVDFDISQAKQIKSAIYNAMFPGGREWSYTNKFVNPLRSMWEIVPVFPDEIEVYMGRIFICHKATEKLQVKFGLDL